MSAVLRKPETHKRIAERDKSEEKSNLKNHETHMQWQRTLITFSCYMNVCVYLSQLPYSHMNVTYLWKCTSRFFFFFVLILSLCVGVKYFCTRFWSKQPLAKSAFYKQQFYGYLCNKATKHVHKCNFAVTKRLSPFVFLCYLACTWPTFVKSIKEKEEINDSYKTQTFCNFWWALRILFFFVEIYYRSELLSGWSWNLYSG